MNIIDAYITELPSAQNALNIFEGEWLSRFPPPYSTLQAGTIPLFQDARITWAAERLGGFAGARILELGPLEGGHSYMLEKLDASSVLAIEANPRAFMKCLITKEILQLKRVEFRLGDFIEFLRQTDEQFDACIASGVLYHMQNPAELIRLIADHTSKVMIWTHYYDEEVIRSHPNLQNGKFSGRRPHVYEGFEHNLYQLNYLDAVNSPKFAGAGSTFSHWMTRDDILRCLEHFGFGALETSFESRNHQHGPCFAIAARKVALRQNSS
jgi:hypothetical protein